VGALDGRVCIVTGAGRGIGREHALYLASQGAKVVVNDLGGNIDGTGADRAPAQQVVDEIEAMGGQAVANVDSVSDWQGAERLIQTAIDTFGTLHVLVNNAGILRDRVIVNMTEDEWDAVINVHLKGHFAPLHHAAAYWRQQSKAGNPVKASVIHTSSESGLFGNPGQANYGAAKAGIASLSIIASKELAKYGVRSNTIAPRARTRLTESTFGSQALTVPEGQFDIWDPANISPVIAWLAHEDCPANGETFFVFGGTVQRVKGWTFDDEHKIEKNEKWTLEELLEEGKRLVG
jgi:NAD(P)-dependent dehydrogenase (short-subunit alcohol dehydrogenase family)